MDRLFDRKEYDVSKICSAIFGYQFIIMVPEIQTTVEKKSVNMV